MKITVKIDNIEVVVDRPKYPEQPNSIYADQEKLKLNTILAVLQEATKTCKELYNLHNQ